MARTLNLLITLFLIAFTAQQSADILTFEDTQTASARLAEECERILSQMNWSQYFKRSDVWEYVDVGSVYNTNIKLHSWNLKPFSFDLSKVNVVIGTGDITLTGTNEINVAFGFNYNATTGLVSKTQGNGILNITSTSFRLVKAERRPEDKIHSILASISITFNVSSSLLSGFDDTTKKYFDEVMKKYANVTINLPSDLQNVVNNYYEVQVRKALDHLDVNVTLPKGNKYRVDFSLVKDPAYSNDGIVYYYSGNTSVVSKPNKFLSKSQADDIVFNKTDGPFQIYMKFDILRPMLNHISKSKNFFFNIRKNTLPRSITFFRLEAEFLGQAFPHVLRTRPRDEEIEITADITNIDIHPTDELQGIATIEFNAFASDGITKLAGWEHRFRYEIFPYEDIEVLDLNFKLRSLKLLDTTVTSGHMAEVDILNSYVERGFAKYIDNENSYNVFAKSIDLNLFFRGRLLNLQITQDGLLMGGYPALHPTMMENTKENLLSQIIEAI